MSSYTYTINNDFSNGLNLIDLHENIKEKISNGFTIFPIGDNIIINFFSALDNDQKNILDYIISNHNPDNYINEGKNCMNVSMMTYKIHRTTYSTINSFIFPGTNSMDVTNIKILSVMQENGISYDIRIVDVTNHETILSLNLNNTDEIITNINMLNKLPKNEAIFDIQAKINGNTIAYLKNLNIYFN